MLISDVTPITDRRSPTISTNHDNNMMPLSAPTDSGESGRDQTRSECIAI